MIDMDNKDPMEWEVLESEYLYQRPWLTARREHVKLPTGAEIHDFYVLEYPEFCNVIAITKDGKFLMERQYRHALGVEAFELPCGVMEKGEAPLDAAKRELLEETGYGGGEWRELMTISPNPGGMNNLTHCFIAEGVEKIGGQSLDEHECLTVHLLDRADVRRLLDENEIFQSLMAAPLWRYFCERKD